MITINLLPEASRKPTATSIRQLHRSPLALVIVGALLGLSLLPAALRGVGQRRLARLQARIQALAPNKRAIDEVKAALAALREQQQTLDDLDRQRSRWASRLNVLSDVIPAGMWLTELTLDPQSTLVLQGVAISQDGEGMTAVTRFVQELKTDPRLAGVIRDIQIDTVQHIQEGEIELMKFTLTCS